MFNVVPFMTGMFEESMTIARENNAARVAQSDKDAENKKLSGTLIADLHAKEFLTGEDASALSKLNELSPAGLPRSDIYSFSNKIEDEEDKDVTVIAGQYKLPFTFDFSDYGKGTNTMMEFNRYLRDNRGAVLSEIESNPSFKNSLTDEVNNAYRNYNLLFYKNNSYDKNGLFIGDSYHDYNENFIEFGDFAKTLGIIPKSKYNVAQVYEPDASENADEMKFYIPMERIEGSEGGVRGFHAPVSEFTKQGSSVEAITALGNIYGMEVRDVFVNVDTMTYGQDKNKTDMSLLNDPDKLNALINGSKLANVQAEEFINLEGAIGPQKLNAIMGVINAIGKGSEKLDYSDEDIGAIQRALFTLIPPSEFAVYQDSLPTVAKSMTGREVAQTRGHKPAEFFEQDQANQESLTMLYSLRDKTAIAGAEGLTAFGIQLFAGFASQITQLGSVFTGDNTDGKFDLFQENLVDEDGTTANTLYEKAEEILGKRRLQTLNEIDALRLTLAAKMARAVDPSGRLSDQDFAIQLRRLGGEGVFVSTEAAINKINTIIDEFENRDKEFTDIRNLMTKTSINSEDLRFLDAIDLRKKIVNRRRTLRRQNRATQQTTKQTTANFGELLGSFQSEDGVSRPIRFNDKDGNYYLDNKQMTSDEIDNVFAYPDPNNPGNTMINPNFSFVDPDDDS